jgi:lipopolysaccharide export system protein LptA
MSKVRNLHPLLFSAAFPMFSPLPKLLRRLGLALVLPATLMTSLIGSDPAATAAPGTPTAAKSSAAPSPQALTLRADVQEANAKTGVVVARGNVQINYPARQIQATSAQAMYFSKERRIVLSGNVYILQQGNSMRGEQITYLIDEGRFVATPQASKQVESIYLVNDAPPAPVAPAPAVAAPAPVVPSPAFGKPQFSAPAPAKP